MAWALNLWWHYVYLSTMSSSKTLLWKVNTYSPHCFIIPNIRIYLQLGSSGQQLGLPATFSDSIALQKINSVEVNYMIYRVTLTAIFHFPLFVQFPHPNLFSSSSFVFLFLLETHINSRWWEPSRNHMSYFKLSLQSQHFKSWFNQLFAGTNLYKLTINWVEKYKSPN